MSLNCLAHRARKTIRRNYFLEYRDTLSGSTWPSLPPVTVTGDGTVKTLEDPNATNQSRYYRVRSEPL